MTKEQFIKELEHIAESGSNEIRLGNLFDLVIIQDRESRWISVRDRLPEIEDADMKGNVLGWDKIQKETHKCNFQDIGQMKMRFSHWQSLPLPPEK